MNLICLKRSICEKSPLTCANSFIFSFRLSGYNLIFTYLKFWQSFFLTVTGSYSTTLIINRQNETPIGPFFTVEWSVWTFHSTSCCAKSIHTSLRNRQTDRESGHLRTFWSFQIKLSSPEQEENILFYSHANFLEITFSWKTGGGKATFLWL